MGASSLSFSRTQTMSTSPIRETLYYQFYALPISPIINAMQGFERLYLELIYLYSLRPLFKDRGSEEQIFRDREKERANGQNQTKFQKL